MSFTLDFKVEIQDATGATALFTDTSLSYGGSNAAYTDVKHIRLLIGEYTKLNALTLITNPTNFTEFEQYVKTAGAAQTYDNKSLVPGSIFIPQTAPITVISGDTFEDMGYYNPYETWLPTANYTPLSLDAITAFGQTVAPIMDSLYAIQYEIYTNEISSFPAAAVVDNQYIVYGGIVAYNGNQYRTGEIFIGADTHNITSVSGSPKVAILYAAAFKNYFLIFSIEQRFYNLVTKATQKDCVCKGCSMLQTLNLIKLTIDGLKYGEFSQQISYTAGYDTVLSLQNQLTELEACNC